MTVPVPPPGWVDDPRGITPPDTVACWRYETPTGHLWVLIVPGAVRISTGPGYAHHPVLDPGQARQLTHGIQLATSWALHYCLYPLTDPDVGEQLTLPETTHA